MFEIGTWTPVVQEMGLEKFIGRTVEDYEKLASQIQERASKQLLYRMGRIYRDATLRCLSGDFGLEDESDGRALQAAFERLVVSQLEKCCA